MAEYITGVTFGGIQWTPSFVTELNQGTCIGCGRCYKVCPRDVFTLVDKSDILDDNDDFDDDYDEDDDNTMVMSIANSDDCIGCEACSKVCPKDCFTHTHKEAA